MKKKIKIICTLGPSSFHKKELHLLNSQKVDIFRINLSHTELSELEEKIIYLKKNKIKNICIDTEGAQIRTTKTKKKYFLKKNKHIDLYNSNKISTNKKIYLYPRFNIKSPRLNSEIDIGFNGLKLKIYKKNISYLSCKVVNEGILESNKGVHFTSKIKLPPLTEKDIQALKISKKMKINIFAISFVNKANDVSIVRKIVGIKSIIISKIETKNALKHLTEISKNSNALLIDRGDLSRYIPIEKIPSVQEYILNKNKNKTPIYVATNLLETMIKENEPTRAESHDIFSTLKQGASGLVLAAETAIGHNPSKTVNFLKKCINTFAKYKSNKLKY